VFTEAAPRSLKGVYRRFLRSRQAADLLLWAVISAPLLFPSDRPDMAGLPLTSVRIAAVPLLACAVLVSRRTPVAAAAVPPALGLAATPELFTANFAVAQLLLAYLLGRRSGRGREALLLSAAVFAAGLPLIFTTPGATPEDGISLAFQVLLTLVLPCLAGRYMRQRAELERTGWELAEKLQREQELAGEKARLRERTRIAQDMHDSLGHELALIAVRASAFQVADDIGPKGREAAAELRRSAAAASRRLREVIGVLREDGQGPSAQPPTDTLASLIERATTAGMAVTLNDELNPSAGEAQTPPMTSRAMYRVVQEALTNAAKHAPGSAVTVALRRDDGHAVVSVVNDAPDGTAAGPTPPSGPGMGLVGLDERVRQAGGTLDARTVDGSYALTARLPLTPGAAATPPGGAGTAQHELALARRKVRRSLIGAVWVPVTAAAVLLVLAVADNGYTADRTVLEDEVYRQLRVGERQSSVEQRLPASEIGGGRRPQQAPADPPGVDECRFYRAPAQAAWPAYRLCFTDSRLSHKDKTKATDRPG
jgi:signal transduction histidine kinase